MLCKLMISVVISVPSSLTNPTQEHPAFKASTGLNDADKFHCQGGTDRIPSFCFTNL